MQANTNSLELALTGDTQTVLILLPLYCNTTLVTVDLL